jgi:hypothetical protein
MTKTTETKPALELTVPQTICLLALSRGEQPPVFPVTTRRLLLREKLIAPRNARAPGSTERRLYDITDAGRKALSASPHLAEAQRALDEGKKQRKPWQ